MKLQTLPIEVNAAEIARGMYDLFSDDEKAAMQLGLLPGLKIQVLRKHLARKLWANFRQEELPTIDQFEAMIPVDGELTYVEFSFQRLVSEAMREIVLELLRVGRVVI